MSTPLPKLLMALLQIGERLAYEAQFVRKSLDPLPQSQQLDKRE